jgi:hypothetical protein
MTKNAVTITLEPDEALVLFDWLTRFNESPPEVFEDQAEQRVLFDLEATLESSLTEPLAANYAELLRDARERVRDEK